MNLSREQPLQMRPRTVGEVLNQTFRLYRQKFSFFIIAGVCFLLPYHILNGYIMIRFGNSQFTNQLQQTLQNLQTGVTSGSSASANVLASSAYIWTMALLIIYSFLVTPLLYGMVVHLMTRLQLYGEESNLNDASTHAFRRLIPSIFTTILIGMLYFVLVFFLSAVVGLIAGVLGTAVPKMIAMPIDIVLFAAMVGMLIWLLVKLAFVPSVVIEEQMSGFMAIGRSWILTKRSFWRLFWFFILVFLVVGVVRAGILLILAMLFKNEWSILVISTILDIFILPLIFLAIANMYTDLRVRTDDLEF